jgi:NitT/TauT family transport system permease protein
MTIKTASGGIWLSVLSVALGIGIWQVVGSLAPRILFAPFSAVVAAFFDSANLTGIWRAIAFSLGELGAGFALAAAVALPLGYLLGRNPICHRISDPLLVAMYSIPPVALVPFLIIWFGLFVESRLALIFIMAFFEMLVITAGGAAAVEPRLLNVGRAFGASRLQTFHKVMLPASLPFLFTALRVGLVRAVAGMITAQLLLNPVNLGKELLDSAAVFDTAAMLAVIAVVALLGLAAQQLLLRVESRVLHWR